MPISSIRSGPRTPEARPREEPTRSPSHDVSHIKPSARFDRAITVNPDNLHEMPVEEHTIELAPADLPNTIITVALKINPGHIGRPVASPAIPAGVSRSDQIESTRGMSEGVVTWSPFTPRAKDLVLGEIDHFLTGTEVGKKWGEISLLKAGGLDHRLIARIKAGESFRTQTVDSLFETMNRAMRGELDPQQFRNTGGRKKPAGGAASQPEESVNGSARHRKSAPRR